MNKLVVFVLLIMSFIKNTYALENEMIVSIEPKNPQVGETIDLNVKIFSDDLEDFKVNFKSIGLEVVGQSNNGRTVRTMIVNGKVTTERSVSQTFSLVAQKAGSYKITNITAKSKTNTLTHEDILFRVQGEAASSGGATNANVFMRLEVDNKSPYLGEGVNARYYIYSKFPIHSPDLLNYPKFEGFVKRFFYPKGAEERVRYNGEIYRRYLRYSVRLYPRQTGKITLDTVSFRVGYIESQSNRLGGGFPFGGFFGGRTRTKIIKSSPITINVTPLPSEGRPQNFSGLVGEHSFRLNLPKDKYLVNEVAELDFEVQGEGLLEEFEPTSFFPANVLEPLDSRSEIEELNEQLAKKKFSLTYLCLKNYKQERREFDFSYFLPREKRYVTKTVTLPDFSVVGTSTTGAGEPDLGVEEQEQGEGASQKVQKTNYKGLLLPLYSGSVLSVRPLQSAALFLFLLVLGQIAFIGRKYYLIQQRKDPIGLMLKSYRGQELSYGHLSRLLSELGVICPGEGLFEIIEKLPLGGEEKSYFEKLTLGQTSVKYNNDYFKKLVRVIKANESSK